MQRGKGWAVMAIAAALCLGLRADDSSATIAAGGLVFQHNDAVRMLREDLYLSPNRVRIHFVFENTTSRDITLLVAFPLPDLPSFIDHDLGTMTKDPLNFNRLSDQG